jgi:hypothetical protein
MKRYSVRATRGGLDWSRASLLTDFSFPWEATPAPGTEFRALWDEARFYFRFDCVDQDLFSADEAWGYVFKGPVNQQKHTAVSDFLHGSFGALNGVVSSYDRGLLDAHLTALRTYEERVVKAVASCSQPVRRAVPSDADSGRH